MVSSDQVEVPTCRLTLACDRRFTIHATLVLQPRDVIVYYVECEREPDELLAAANRFAVRRRSRAVLVKGASRPQRLVTVALNVRDGRDPFKELMHLGGLLAASLVRALDRH